MVADYEREMKNENVHYYFISKLPENKNYVMTSWGQKCPAFNPFWHPDSVLHSLKLIITYSTSETLYGKNMPHSSKVAELSDNWKQTVHGSHVVECSTVELSVEPSIKHCIPSPEGMHAAMQGMHAWLRNWLGFNWCWSKVVQSQSHSQQHAGVLLV